MPRQQALDQRDWPGLERFGQKGVVRVGDRRVGNLPGLLPIELMLVDEEPHQLRHGKGWMCIVELDRCLLGEVVEAAELPAMTMDQVLQRGRGEEEFLPKAQFLPGWRRVVGIEDLRDRLGPVAFGDRADEVALVEGVEGERMHGPRPPEPQGRRVTAAPAYDRRVIGDGEHGFFGRPDDLVWPAGHHRTAEADAIGRFAPLELPGVAE